MEGGGKKVQVMEESQETHQREVLLGPGSLGAVGQIKQGAPEEQGWSFFYA